MQKIFLDESGVRYNGKKVIISATRFSYKYPRFAGSLSDKSFA